MTPTEDVYSNRMSFTKSTGLKQIIGDEHNERRDVESKTLGQSPAVSGPRSKFPPFR